MHTCTHTCVNIRIHPYADVRSRRPVYTHTTQDVYTGRLDPTSAYVYIRMYTHVCVYVYIRMYTHVCVYVCIRRLDPTHTHTHKHTYIHTHTHTGANPPTAQSKRVEAKMHDASICFWETPLPLDVEPRVIVSIFSFFFLREHFFFRRAHCTTLHHNATHCNALQHTATHCNTLQHTARRENNARHLNLSLVHPTSIRCRALPHRETVFFSSFFLSIFFCSRRTNARRLILFLGNSTSIRCRAPRDFFLFFYFFIFFL